MSSKTIKEVLEKLVSQNGAELLTDRLNHPSIDQALLDIQEIIKECKPRIAEPTRIESSNMLATGWNNSADEYQSNLEKRLK